MTKSTLTVPEAGKVLGVGRTHAYRMAREGEIPVVRLGHRMLVPVSQLEERFGIKVADDLLTDASATT